MTVLDVWLADPDIAYAVMVGGILLAGFVFWQWGAPQLANDRRRPPAPAPVAEPLPRRTPRPVPPPPASHWSDTTTVHLAQLAEQHAVVRLRSLMPRGRGAWSR